MTRTSKRNKEAIKCLKEQNDRPHLVQEEHIHSIVDFPPVKDGSDKVLHSLYDTVSIKW